VRTEDSKGTAPQQVPIQPVELTLDSKVRFHCYKGISCYNECCRSIDFALTPYDIVRLKRRLNVNSSEFVARYTTVYPMDHHNLPGLKMNVKPGTSECVFLAEQG